MPSNPPNTLISLWCSGLVFVTWVLSGVFHWPGADAIAASICVICGFGVGGEAVSGYLSRRATGADVPAAAPVPATGEGASTAPPPVGPVSPPGGGAPPSVTVLAWFALAAAQMFIGCAGAPGAGFDWQRVTVEAEITPGTEDEPGVKVVGAAVLEAEAFNVPFDIRLQWTDESVGACVHAWQIAVCAKFDPATGLRLGVEAPIPAGQTMKSRPLRACEWCGSPIVGRRRDATTCSNACRHARWRFRVAGAPAGATGGPCAFAYADPPYPGLARRYYGCEEVDHGELIARLCRDYPDGWALSTSADALNTPHPKSGAPEGVLALCPPGARICPWVRGSRPGVSYRARVAWEPLIVVGGRQRRLSVAEDLDDVLLWGGRQHSHPGALVGMKSAAFCEWMFRLLGAERQDTLDDLFPGSGAVTRAWGLYTSPDPGRDASRATSRRYPETFSEASADASSEYSETSQRAAQRTHNPRGTHPYLEGPEPDAVLDRVATDGSRTPGGTGRVRRRKTSRLEEAQQRLRRTLAAGDCPAPAPVEDVEA